MTVPILDTFLGLSEKFPENELKKLLNEYRAVIPEAHIQYLKDLKSRRD